MNFPSVDMFSEFLRRGKGTLLESKAVYQLTATSKSALDDIRVTMRFYQICVWIWVSGIPEWQDSPKWDEVYCWQHADTEGSASHQLGTLHTPWWPDLGLETEDFIFTFFLSQMLRNIGQMRNIFTNHYTKHHNLSVTHTYWITVWKVFKTFLEEYKFIFITGTVTLFLRICRPNVIAHFF